MPERTLALVLEYDGTFYRGFQRQDGLPSVAERVEAALETLFGRPAPVVAAGRTDAGVHATGQVISCTTSSEMPVARVPVAASALLRHSSIAVVRAVERPKGFSARHDALARTYRYKILNRVAPSPLWFKRAFHIGKKLDLEAMRDAASRLIGEHDFAAFCAAASRERRCVRNLEVLELARAGEFIECVATADSFVHNMVRIIVGTLIEIGRGHHDPADILAVLESKDRKRAGFTAPAHGLYLESVRYDPPI